MSYTQEEIRAQASAARREVGWLADMYDSMGNLVQSLPIVGGGVTFQGEQTEQWACDIRLADPSLVPLKPSDVLDPRGGNRCQVWWTLRMPDGGLAKVPCGRYSLEDPEMEDNGSELSYSMSGRDILAQARRGGYPTTLSVGGMTVPDALRTVFGSICPGAPLVVGESSVTLPSTFELAEGDPAKDWTDIASLSGWVVRSDAVGTIVAGPTPVSDLVAAEWQEGVNCAVTAIKKSVATSSMINRVLAISTNPEVTPPLVGLKEDDDPGSSTWVGVYGPFQTTIRSDAIATQEGADGMARATYERWRHPMETVEVSVPARPDLGYRDLCNLAARRIGVSGEYRVSSWETQITPPNENPSDMKVTMMTRAIQ